MLISDRDRRYLDRLWDLPSLPFLGIGPVELRRLGVRQITGLYLVLSLRWKSKFILPYAVVACTCAGTLLGLGDITSRSVCFCP